MECIIIDSTMVGTIKDCSLGTGYTLGMYYRLYNVMVTFAM